MFLTLSLGYFLSDSDGKSQTIVLDVNGIDVASMELHTIREAIGEAKQGYDEKEPETITRPAPTPRPLGSSGGLYSLIRKSLIGAQTPSVPTLSSVTPVLPSVPCLPEDDDELETEQLSSIRGHSGEAKMDGLEESAEIKDPDAGVKESGAPTVANHVRELNSSAKSADAGSQPR